MVKETEIKLRASHETLQALRHHPLLSPAEPARWQQHQLYNQYYDTPTNELARARVALRLRCDGERFIQTLKSRGQSVAGLSVRDEWEWLLQNEALDLALLDESCWPAQLADLDKHRLQPLFKTDFTRDKTEIAYGQARIEVALDEGEVVAGQKREAISEVELELHAGDTLALLDLACELARELPLMPCDISKAERGYRLLDSRRDSAALPSLELPAGQTLDEALAILMWHLLGSSQRLAEQYRWSGHWKALESWVQQLVDIRALLSSLGQAAPRASSRELRELLDALLADWRPRIVSGQADAQVRQQAPQQFTEELQQTRWGLFSLLASRWVSRQGWQQGRNARGDRQGSAALERWLMRELGEQAAALNLRHYQQIPESLRDQQPRLERILVWLRLARSVLAVDEIDRLFGETGKLYASLDEPRSEQLDEWRARQIQQIMSLKPWKALVK